MVKKSKLINILITLVLIMQIISWVFFMPIAQLQLAVFQKRIVTFFHYGIIEIAALLLLIFLNRDNVRINGIAKSTLKYIGVIILLIFVNILISDDITAYKIMFFVMTWIMPFLLLFVVAQYNYNIDNFLKKLLYIIIVHALLIIYQRFSNSIVWPFSTYEDGTKVFYTGSGYFDTRSFLARCPGMTISGLDAGILLIFGLVLLFTLDSTKKWLKIMVAVLFIVAIFFTGTRSVYILAVYMFGMSLVMNLKINQKRKKYLTVFITFLAALIYATAVLGMDTFNVTGNLFTDTASIMYRLQEWDSILDTISSNGFIHQLFGNLKWQQSGDCQVIDNFYLETVYCIGILGLIVFVINIINTVKICVKNNSISSFISSSFVLSFFVYGVLNSMSCFFITLNVLLVIKCINEKHSQIS